MPAQIIDGEVVLVQSEITSKASKVAKAPKGGRYFRAPGVSVVSRRSVPRM
jgi:hypothetical protein